MSSAARVVDGLAASAAVLLEQEYALVDVNELRPHPRNPRRGDLDGIAGSIDVNGFFGAIVAQRSTTHVLVGNHRLAAAKARGATVVPVLWVDVDDDAALRILLVENRMNDLASTDDAVLAEVFELLQASGAGTDGTGYDDDLVAEILAAARPAEALTDVDDAPDYPEADPISIEGDVWQLGPHRVVCGNATSIEDVRVALNERPAGLLFTDPPYGVSYRGGTAKQLTIQNDDLTPEQLRELLDGAFAAAAQVLAPGASFYVCSPSGALETLFRLALDQARLPLRQQIVWVKDRFVLGRADYHGQHETIFYGWQLDGTPAVPPHFEDEHGTVLYGWKPGAGHTWEGGRKQSTVWEHERPARSAEHPTMKPVELVRRAIENNTRPGALVLDTFGGSGSTLIACHHAGRVAALVELDPKYVDVICRRWEQHTGELPVRAATGEAVSFLEAA
ncbi:MAG TPA: DNA methyltransferase [Nocardioides sp.]|uniref:DNA methyltransferase n=1 Tax=Nocardioides sp. TaxID=35761 RepID=UPI002C9F7A52|nr:DNA methyltransferase [Nocardioides sp.]HTW17067.1 DNA methyltransferase [Nocardioides sp.]